MRILFLFSALIFPVLLSAQQPECKEKPADLASKTAIQVDTIHIIDPETYEQTKKLTRIYHAAEMSIVDRIKKGNRTYFYVEKDDCLVIRHVTEIIE